MNFQKTRGFLLFALAVAVFLVYLSTAAPGAWWGDGLEFTCAAKTLGIPHPTGYPLYLLLGFGAIHALGFLDPGRAMTVMSASFCAGSVWILAEVIDRIIGRHGDGATRERGEAKANEGATSRESKPCGSVSVVAGATLIFAFTRTLWEHATFAEVYPLTLLLVVAMVALAERAPKLNPESSSKWVVGMGILWGLALLNHYSAAAIFPLLLLTLISASPRRRVFFSLSIFAAVSSPFLLGYLYPPLRASANPPINFGDPSNWKRFLWMLKGGSYVGQNWLGGQSPLLAVLSGIGFWLDWWGRQFLAEPLAFGLIRVRNLTEPLYASYLIFGFVISAYALAGCCLLSQNRPAWGIGLIASLLITALFSILYPIPDRDAYFLPALPAATLGWIELILFLSKQKQPSRDHNGASDNQEVASWSLPYGRGSDGSLPPQPLSLSKGVGRVRVHFLLYAPLVIGLLLLAEHYPHVNKSWDDGPKRWADAVLKALPPDSLILTRQGSDAEIYALWHEQIVNGQRPDVTVFGTGFIFSGWYRKYFDYPGRPKLPLFITDRPPGDKGVFDVALIGGVILPNAGNHRVFSTYMDETLRNDLAPRPFVRLLPDAYYSQTEYRLNPPGPVLYELHAEPRLDEFVRKKFFEIFGQPPPSESGATSK